MVHGSNTLSPSIVSSVLLFIAMVTRELDDIVRGLLTRRILPNIVERKGVLCTWYFFLNRYYNSIIDVCS